ncbi:uncharacterized protein B0H18DRAFT_981377 [Fomitopsis serialis]|uniref:uncharacterized protein n=1 Tax=Fomitopsis serialis TaxID=139415 RepID=UPI0020079C28|nr:uncharacterized protein B0H18DRAFT_981377 [Neoantrodia serialis]KAH9934363.1 hypothetical protein B0H18DRAFT_981377 [Neoantrodia serialis]
MHVRKRAKKAAAHMKTRAGEAQDKDEDEDESSEESGLDGDDDIGDEERAQRQETLAERKADARKIWRSTPAELRVHMREQWFATQWKLGMRQARSLAVLNVADNARGVFDIMDKDFEDKGTRVNLPEVQALYKEKQFLYSGAPGKADGHLWHPCIVNACVQILNGKKALHAAKKNTKTRSTNAQLWGMDGLNHAAIAFGATCVRFNLYLRLKLICSSRYTSFSRAKANLWRLHPEDLTSASSGALGSSFLRDWLRSFRVSIPNSWHISTMLCSLNTTVMLWRRMTRTRLPCRRTLLCW